MTVKQILLAILLVLVPLILFATDYYIATKNLNVRTGAGVGYTVLYTLQRGEEVEIISREDSWYQIKYAGKIGYAHSKYLKYSRAYNGSSEQSREQKDRLPIIGVLVGFALIAGFVSFWRKQRSALLKRNSELGRGTRSERALASTLLRYGIPEQHIFHDLYLEKYKGHFSQIDLVAITEVGIIVFEVKDYSGWIFGSGNRTQWTKVLNYGHQKHRFYNPILQNNKHISELKKQFLPFNSIPIYSIVVFYGDCELKEIDFVPNGTFIVKSQRVLEVMDNILKENKPVEYTNEAEIIRILKEAVTNGDVIENQLQHNENIKDMLGKHRVFD